MKKVLSLEISTAISIQWWSENPVCGECTLYDFWSHVCLEKKEQILQLSRARDGYFLWDYLEHIQKCLDNKIVIQDLSINHQIDIGLIWHEYIQNTFLRYIPNESINSLDRNFLKSILFEYLGDGFNSCMTFLYNDEEGNIVLQVSSAYPWFFEDTPPQDQYISYQDWLPQYKILYKAIIPREIAQGWVEQLTDLYTKLEANMPFAKS